MKILIVEDDNWLAETHRLLLSAAGHDVKIVNHALAAIDEIDNFQPEALILDILLPVATGFSLLHEMQSYADTGQLPVIVTTSIASDLDLEDLRPYGVRRILDKSTMKPDDLLSVVRNLV